MVQILVDSLGSMFADGLVLVSLAVVFVDD